MPCSVYVWVRGGQHAQLCILHAVLDKQWWRFLMNVILLITSTFIVVIVIISHFLFVVIIIIIQQMQQLQHSRILKGLPPSWIVTAWPFCWFTMSLWPERASLWDTDTVPRLREAFVCSCPLTKQEEITFSDCLRKDHYIAGKQGCVRICKQGLDLVLHSKEITKQLISQSTFSHLADALIHSDLQ